MNKRYVQGLVVVFLMLAVISWQFDLSKGSLGYYDVISLAPYSFFHTTGYFLLMIVSLYFGKSSLFNILALSLYYPVVQLVNYPFLTFRDVYLHGAPVEAILSTWHLDSMGQSEAAYWPSSFILHDSVILVLGCNIVEANYLLYGGLIAALALTIHSFARRLNNRGYTAAWTFPLLFLGLLNSPGFQVHHYSRSGLSLVFLFLFLFAFAHSNNRQWRVLQLLLIASLVTTHAFTSLYIVVFLFGYVVLTAFGQTRDAPRTLGVALFSGAFFVAWWMFNARPNFEEAIPYFIGNLLSAEYLTPLQKATSITDPVPLWGILLRNYYKYSLLSLIGMATLASFLILVHTKRKQSSLSSEVKLFISVLAVSGIFIFVMLGMPAWSLYRAAGFVSIAAAFSPLICVELMVILSKRRTTALTCKKVIRLFTVLFIVSLSMTSTVLRFEQNVYAGELEHPSELLCLSYLFDSNSHPVTIAMSWKTSIYYKYFDYALKDRVLMYVDIWKVVDRKIKTDNHTEVALCINETIAESTVLVRGTRDYYLIYSDFPENLELIGVIDNVVLSERVCKTFANGYWSLYLRAERGATSGEINQVSVTRHVWRVGCTV
jgi:hypothetical protein